MTYTLATLVAEVLARLLATAKVGVYVAGLSELDAITVVAMATELANRVPAPLYLCTPGVRLTASPPTLTVADTIEQAVQWRNTPHCAGRIVVVVQNENRLPKLQSLMEFDTLTALTLCRHLVDTMTARCAGTPARAFWETLGTDVESLALHPLLDLVNATAGTPTDEALLQDQVWRLGLLRDPALFQNPARQLARQRLLLNELQQLSKTRRTRMLQVVTQAPQATRASLQTTYHHLAAYIHSGERTLLRHLSYPAVLKLLNPPAPLSTPLTGSVPALSDLSSSVSAVVTSLPSTQADISPTAVPDALTAMETPTLWLRALLTSWYSYTAYGEPTLYLTWLNPANSVAVVSEITTFLHQNSKARVVCRLTTTPPYTTSTTLKRHLLTEASDGITQQIRQSRLTVQLTQIDSLATLVARLEQNPSHLLILSYPTLTEWQNHAGRLLARGTQWLAVETGQALLPAPANGVLLRKVSSQTEDNHWELWASVTTPLLTRLLKQSQQLQLPLTLATLQTLLQAFAHLLPGGLLTVAETKIQVERKVAEARIMVYLLAGLWCSHQFAKGTHLLVSPSSDAPALLGITFSPTPIAWLRLTRIRLSFTLADTVAPTLKNTASVLPSHPLNATEKTRLWVRYQERYNEAEGGPYVSEEDWMGCDWETVSLHLHFGFDQKATSKATPLPLPPNSQQVTLTLSEMRLLVQRFEEGNFQNVEHL